MRKLAFLKHVNFINSCCVTFKVHETIECELLTSDIKK